MTITMALMILISIILSATYARNVVFLGVSKGFPAGYILQTLGYTQLAQFGLIFPMALLLGLTLSLTRMTEANEIVALRSAGMSFLDLSRPFMKLAVAGFLIMLFWHQCVIPWARGNFRQLRDTIEDYAPLDFAADAGILQSSVDHAKIERVMRFESKAFDTRYDTHRFYNVHILEMKWEKSENKIQRVIYAKEALKTSMNDATSVNVSSIKLSAGYIIDLRKRSGYDLSVVYFPVDGLYLRLGTSAQKIIPERAKDSTYLPELIRKRDLLQSSPDIGRRHDALDYSHEIHQRTALPFAVPAMVWLGLCLTLARFDRPRWLMISAAGIVIAAYYAVFLIGKMVSTDTQMLAPWLAAWLPNILVLFLSLGLLIRWPRTGVRPSH